MRGKDVRLEYIQPAAIYRPSLILELENGFLLKNQVGA